MAGKVLGLQDWPEADMSKPYWSCLLSSSSHSLAGSWFPERPPFTRQE